MIFRLLIFCVKAKSDGAVEETLDFTQEVLTFRRRQLHFYGNGQSIRKVLGLMENIFRLYNAARLPQRLQRTCMLMRDSTVKREP